MSPWRKKGYDNSAGRDEAREALSEASRGLAEVRARWPVVHAVSATARQVNASARYQKVTNHLGDLFAEALRGGHHQP